MKRVRVAGFRRLWSGWLLLATAPAWSGQQQFFICTDYHCDSGEMVALAPDDWQSVRDLFAPDASAAEERDSVRRAIALLESRVGDITGTWRDLAGNVAGAGKPGQLDCISESKNTTTYLALLAGDGLLKHHEVEGRRVRRPFIFDVHWTAVIRERGSGQRYAVDSWFLDNGQLPHVQELEQWLSGRPFE